jgi:hypothetical protein
MDNAITGRVKLPALGQVGVVVRDVERVMEFYSSTFRIGPWVTREGDSEARAGNQTYRYKTKAVFAQLGPIILELFQLTEGRSPVHSDFLDKEREGVHHLGFYMSEKEKEQIVTDRNNSSSVCRDQGSRQQRLPRHGKDDRPVLRADCRYPSADSTNA